MADAEKGLFKRFRHWLLETRALYFFVAAWIYFFDALPLGFGRFLGRCGGRLAYHLDFGHRTVSLDNLAIAFPEKSLAERRAILKKSYIHLGICVVDFSKFKRLSNKDLLERWIVPEDGAVERGRLARAEGRGIIAVAAHIGFWELSGFAFPALGYQVISIARKIASPHIDDFVNGIRARLGNEICHQDGALRHMLRALKDNKSVGLIMDQFAGKESPWVQFFTREASTVDTAARLHMRTNAVLQCNLMIRRPDGKYTWRCRSIDVPPPAGESDNERVLIILRAINSEFERAIRETPEQWLWMHKRWKPKPNTVSAAQPAALVGNAHPTS